MRKLKLKKDVIATMGGEDMNSLKGGSDWFCGGTGGTCHQATCDENACNIDLPTPEPTNMLACGTGPCTGAPTPEPTPTPDFSSYVTCIGCGW